MKIFYKKCIHIFFKLNSYIIFISTMLIYGSILELNSYCQESSRLKEKKLCVFFSNISKPQAVFTDGIKSLRQILIFKSGSGMLATNIYDSRERFSSYERGFNFNYEKGARNKAGYLLLSYANPDKFGSPSIELWDLNQQIILKSWDLSNAIKLVRKKSKRPVTYFNNPIILEDKSLLFNSNGAAFFKSDAMLIKLDKDGNILGFNNKYLFHHSINLDSNGLIFVCITDKNDLSKGEGFAILDQNLNIISTYFIRDIYEKNNLTSRLFSNDASDPIHINDVEPLSVDKESGTENVLISLRSLSSIINFSLKTGKIIWILDGITSQQHDVDIINSNPLEITIFDNNIRYKKESKNKILFIKNLDIEHSYNSDDILLISPNTTTFKTSNIKLKYEDFDILGDRLRPKTSFGGLSEFNKRDNSIIIEEENHGRIFEYDFDTEKILWTFINASEDKNLFYRLMWSRFYPSNPLIKN